jgi:3-hydroxybutyryl-CoA dehydrogenase
MGNGIAQVCAVAGLQVTMVDINDAAVQRGLKTIGGQPGAAGPQGQAG